MTRVMHPSLTIYVSSVSVSFFRIKPGQLKLGCHWIFNMLLFLLALIISVSQLVWKLHLHLSLNHESCWGTTDDFKTSLRHFSLFSTALWDLVNPRPVYSLMSSPHLFFCLVFLSFSLCLTRWFWPDLMNSRHVHTTAVCISLRSSGLRVVQMPAGFCHGLPLC